MKQERTQTTPEEARQGQRGRPVLAVLLTSVALVVIGFAFLSWLLAVDIAPTIGGIETSEQSGSLTDG